MNTKGQIIILNGAPRSGKSSIARVIQDSFDGVWVNMGVDHYREMLPEHFQPAIGLRPGGERPDMEPLVATLYQALYASIAAHSRLGLHVVADVGHHDAYSASLGILPRCARILRGYPVLFVGVFCPIEVIMERRMATWATPTKAGVPKPVRLWQHAVHAPGIYDLELDTSRANPEQCAAMIREYLEERKPMRAFRTLAERE